MLDRILSLEEYHACSLQRIAGDPCSTGIICGAEDRGTRHENVQFLCHAEDLIRRTNFSMVQLIHVHTEAVRYSLAYIMVY